jgi:beta-N-acetylhexosaminidase
MGLPEKKTNGTLVPGPEALEISQCEEHVTWAKECADMAVTLVKDTRNILPLNVKKHKKVLLEIIGDFASNDRVREHFVSLLEKEGFDITLYQPETLETIFLDGEIEKFKSKYDLALYIGNIENASNKTVARINWHTLFGAGNNLPWFAKEVPTVFVSVGNPYHLFDVPMIPTYINGYCHSPYVIDAVVEKLMGRSTFKGISPIDPFCGMFGTDL